MGVLTITALNVKKTKKKTKKKTVHKILNKTLAFDKIIVKLQSLELRL